MTDLRARLRAFLDNPAARRLARAAPAALLAGGVGVTLGAVIGLPSFATSGLGIVLGNIAANLTSALIEPILTATDDDARADAIERGLVQNDPDVMALAAAALTYAGPALAQALPEAARTELIAALERAMREAGGPLDAIAARYGAALRDPQANWSALQAELRQTIADIHLVAKVGDHGVITGLKQRVENPTGATKVEALGGHGARLENVEQIVSNTRQPAAAPALTCPDCGAPVRAGQPTCARCGLPLSGGHTQSARDPPASLLLTISFSPTGADAAVRWEADVLGVRASRFTSPYHGADLPLVVRALDVLQYPNYPNPETPGQRQRFTFSAEEQARLAALELWDAARVPPDTHQRVGRALYRALAADPIGAQALGTARDHAAASGHALALALRFPPHAVALAALPWELLWDDGATPLLLSRGRLAACTRHLDLAEALPPPQMESRPLQILAVAPQAGIPAEVRAEERAARIAAWQPLLASGQAVMNEVNPATRRALVDAIQGGPPPNIVHYYGHGRYRDGAGALLLDGPGGHDWIGVSELAALLGGARLLALYACQGAMIDGTGDNLLTGVAPALSAAGVSLVIGMQLTVRVEAATRASGVIYRALAAGESIQAAVSQARQALYVEERDGASWYVPALYIRSRDTGPAYLL